MSFLVFSLLPFLWLASTAIEIFAFFIVVRLAATSWSFGWLRSFDAVGRPIVDKWLVWVDTKTDDLGQSRFSSNAKLVLTMVLVWAIHGMLVLVGGAILGGAPE